jgi:hypothetical protein
MPDELRAQGPTETPGCDCHENIPKDENGVPIFFILPPDIRAKYERRLSGFERAWNATKDPAYFRQALAWNHLHRQPTSRWLYEAGDAIAAERRTRQHDERYLDRQRHFLRYEIVRAFREAGLTLDEALDKACERLGGMGAAASRSTVADSYDRIRRELRTNRFGRYKPLVHGRYRTINGRPVE